MVSQARKDWVTQKTLELIEVKHKEQARLRRARKEMEREKLRMMFTAWNVSTFGHTLLEQLPQKSSGTLCQ